MRHPVPTFMHIPCTTICSCHASGLPNITPCRSSGIYHTHAMRYGIRIDLDSSYITSYTHAMRNTVRHPVPSIFIRMACHTACGTRYATPYAPIPSASCRAERIRHAIQHDMHTPYDMACGSELSAHYTTRDADSVSETSFMPCKKRKPTPCDTAWVMRNPPPI